MVFALFAMQMAVWAQEASGYCGDPNVNEGKDVTWSVVDGTLTISGVGAMADYDWAGPWSAFNKVVVTEGVTSIGRCAFNFCSGFTDITLPNSLVSIGQSAFSFCSGLSSVLVPNSVTTIGDGAFSFCGGLTHVKLPDGITAIGDDMFCYSSNLTTITIPATVTHIGQSAFLQSALAEVICVNPIPPPSPPKGAEICSTAHQTTRNLPEEDVQNPSGRRSENDATEGGKMRSRSHHI